MEETLCVIVLKGETSSKILKDIFDLLAKHDAEVLYATTINGEKLWEMYPKEIHEKTYRNIKRAHEQFGLPPPSFEDADRKVREELKDCPCMVFVVLFKSKEDRDQFVKEIGPVYPEEDKEARTIRGKYSWDNKLMSNLRPGFLFNVVHVADTDEEVEMELKALGLTDILERYKRWLRKKEEIIKKNIELARKLEIM